MSTAIVLQGPIYSYTPEVINKFQEFKYTENIIVSTHNGQEMYGIESLNKVKVVIHKDVENPGTGNRNKQIVSTLAGLEMVNSINCIKARTDQIIFNLEELYDFYLAYKTEDRIFCQGSYPNVFPFHPADHFFLSSTVNINKLFNIPLDPNLDNNQNYTDQVRAETYIGQYYYAKHDPKVESFIANPGMYLTDQAPNKQESFDIENKWLDKLFKALPVIDFEWKRYPNHSHYQVARSYGLQ